VAGIVTALAGLAYTGVLAYEMWRQTFKMRQYGEGAETLEIPFWPFALFVAFVAAVMTMQCLVHLVRAATGRFAENETYDHERPATDDRGQRGEH
jgi:TRAP-type C4-dicarboxylate transport system permease small subunit